jgi:flagellar hook-associated protein 3 FlgL
MRVATPTVYRDIQQNIVSLYSDLNQMQEKVSSGKNFNSPSDDPVAMVNSLGLSDTLAQIQQYQTNMNTANEWLSTSETALNQVSQLAASAQQIAAQFSSGSQSADVQTEAESQVDGLIDEAIDLGNTQLNGKYIFAGYQTATTPFADSGSGATETVVYQADPTNDFNVQIGPNETVTAGKNGQTVFMDSNLFTSLIGLKQAIANNDQTAIQQEATNLQGATDYLNAQVSDVGIRQSQLQTQGQMFTQVSTNLQNQLGDLENVDYNQAILEMQQKQTAYNAALETAVQISQVSLLNYLNPG